MTGSAEWPEVGLPDEDLADKAAERLHTLDVPGHGLGVFADFVRWAAGVQARETPQPFRAVRVVAVAADHGGGLAAGSDPPAIRRQLRQELAGEGLLAKLAGHASARVDLIDVGLAGPEVPGVANHRLRDEPLPIESADALTDAEAARAVRFGIGLAERVADEGGDLIVLAALGSGQEAAAAAMLTPLSGKEPPELLGRVITADGRVDDAAWMRRCVAVRDALRWRRDRNPDAMSLLAAIGGPGFATATGAILGAAARRTPVLVDGPLGATAALLVRDLAPQAPRWCLLPHASRHPTVRLVSDLLDLEPLVDLRLALGEGADALAVLPLLQAGLTLVGELPSRSS